MKMMKNVFFVGIAALTFSLCACGTTSESKKSEEPVEEWVAKTPEYLTTLPIPSDLEKDCEEKGTVEVCEYQTKIYDINGNGTTTVNKKAEVYLPYDYDENEYYNVLYLLHGANVREGYWLTDEKQTVKVLDNVFSQGIADPCIIVCPTYYTDPNNSGNDITDIFKYEFRNDLVPAIEEHYATYCDGDVSEDNLIETRIHRGLAGLSMGSMTTMRAGLIGNLDILAFISNMSGGYGQNDNDGSEGFDKVKEAVTETFADYPLLYWLNQNGTSDMALGPHQALNDLILSELDDYFVEDENYKWILFQGGQHNFDAWLVHLYNTLQIFF